MKYNRLDKEVIKGSLILLIVFNIYSLLNFIFQSSMARFLTLGEYGTLAALSYLLYILAVFTESIQTIVSKYSSQEKDNGKLNNIVNRMGKKLLKPTMMIFIFYLIVSIFISKFAKIPYSLLLLNSFIIFLSVYLPITRGILQGRKRFYSLGINLIVESGIKLILGITLVLIGWKLYGALSSIVIGMFIALLISIISTKSILSSSQKDAKVGSISAYSLPVFITIFSILAFYTLDIFIAQFIFDKETAGIYSIASMLSKIIFWGIQPIGRAMFSLSAERKNLGSRKALFNAFGLTTICIIISLAVFLIFPNLLIKIFSGKDNLQAVSILFYLGLSTSFLSYANLIILYKNSKGKITNPYILLVVLALSIIGLLLSSASLITYSITFLLFAIMFLLCSILLKTDKNENSNNNSSI